jgi:hypothetical protein
MGRDKEDGGKDRKGDKSKGDKGKDDKDRDHDEKQASAAGSARSKAAAEPGPNDCFFAIFLITTIDTVPGPFAANKAMKQICAFEFVLNFVRRVPCGDRACVKSHVSKAAFGAKANRFQGPGESSESRNRRMNRRRKGCSTCCCSRDRALRRPDGMQAQAPKTMSFFANFTSFGSQLLAKPRSPTERTNM